MTVTFEGVEVKAGDKVKIRWTQPAFAVEGGMRKIEESVDWLVVDGQLDAGRYVLSNANVTILAHEPAPRKVEVELGEVYPPFEYSGEKSTKNKDYPDACDGFSYEYLGAGRNSDGEDLSIFIKVGEGATTLAPETARQFALDLLATVGAE